MSDKEKIINRLISDIEHLNKVIQFQRQENIKLRKALQLIAYGENDMQVNRINAREALGEDQE